jgi:hypothetical protein
LKDEDFVILWVSPSTQYSESLTIKFFPNKPVDPYGILSNGMDAGWRECLQMIGIYAKISIEGMDID